MYSTYDDTWYYSNGLPARRVSTRIEHGDSTSRTSSETRPRGAVRGPSLTVVSPQLRAGTLAVSYTLTSDAPAKVEVLDVTGRRLAQCPIQDSKAGGLSIDVMRGKHLGPGVYFVRLVQGPGVRVARVVVLP
jgi:hypothetical protein